MSINKKQLDGMMLVEDDASTRLLHKVLVQAACRDIRVEEAVVINQIEGILREMLENCRRILILTDSDMPGAGDGECGLGKVVEVIEALSDEQRIKIAAVISVTARQRDRLINDLLARLQAMGIREGYVNKDVIANDPDGLSAVIKSVLEAPTVEQIAGIGSENKLHGFGQVFSAAKNQETYVATI